MKSYTALELLSLPPNQREALRFYALILGFFHLGVARAEDLEYAKNLLLVQMPELKGEFVCSK